MYNEWLTTVKSYNSFCLCEVGENASLLAKGLNSSLKSSDILLPTGHDLVEAHTCNYTLSLSKFEADVDLISFLHW